ncbi:MAG: TolC family protein [Planctomycetales bacterium]|nr:TolC family protein [Planctomycetales bacterium]
MVSSIHSTFPLLEAAYQQYRIAAGKHVAAWGAFDTKLKGASENGPVGFYETYRHQAGLSQPIYHGGEIFGGYRIGRGEFQPWYLERQTNDSGEFKAGLRVPLLRNREIDARRAEVWRATYDRQRAEPEVLAELIHFVRDGSIAYWNWVAAGRKYEIGKHALTLAEQRNAQLRRKVDVGDIDPPVLQDNLRAIAQREAKLIDLRRKVEQSAIKLSLFYRSDGGQPLIADQTQLVDFPPPTALNGADLPSDAAIALANRPELAMLDALVRRVNVDAAEARNDMLPNVDAQIVGSQDVGPASSSKGDKTPFELEAGIFVDVPLQRRKAIGKSRAADGKLVQLAAKRRYTVDKIRAEVQTSHAALDAAFQRLAKARESLRLADYMAEVERRKFELGESDLLSVTLREQYAIEAAEAEVDALTEFYTARAEYDAALARDWPPQATTDHRPVDEP